MQLITQKSKTKQLVKKETRVDKARALVKSIMKNEDGTSYAVPSQSNPDKVYTVRLQLGAGRSQGYTCTCPDFEHRGQVGGSAAVEANCKHITAVEMFNGDYDIKQTIKRMARGAL
jgi:hypothetical protein